MPDAGDIVIVEFAGAESSKVRPAVVLSTPVYHANRPDVILGLLTSNIGQATTPTDYLLQDWAVAGLKRPTAFCAYLLTLNKHQVPTPIGKLTARDWQEVQTCLSRALACGPAAAP
jgi:mRNA interferase MazF